MYSDPRNTMDSHVNTRTIYLVKNSLFYVWWLLDKYSFINMFLSKYTNKYINREITNK
jgi:hypothetical protein